MIISRRSLSTWVATVVAIGIALALWRGIAPNGGPPQNGGDSPFQMLEGLVDEGFARVQFPWGFQFPADHGGHDAYRTEWWFLSGVLTGQQGARLGVQLALVRLGLTAAPKERSSRWAASGIYTGLFSVSDPAGREVRTYRRTSRAALGLAGTALSPARIWVEDWRLEQVGSEDEAPVFRLRIPADDLELELNLRSTQPLINSDQLRDQGFAQSAPFHLYMQPRFASNGALRVGSKQTAVSGDIAMEHAWGELPLPGGPVARDRFTLLLDDGRELLCLHTHRVDGSGAPTTTGLLIDRDNQALVLTRNEIELRPTAYWTSARTNAKYPTHWALRVPRKGIELDLIPYGQEQEGMVWAPFWAGPVKLQGTSGERVGDGFVQLNGYENR